MGVAAGAFPEREKSDTPSCHPPGPRPPGEPVAEVAIVSRMQAFTVRSFVRPLFARAEHSPLPVGPGRWIALYALLLPWRESLPCPGGRRLTRGDAHIGGWLSDSGGRQLTQSTAMMVRDMVTHGDSR